MPTKDIMNQMRDRVSFSAPGAVFVPSDFADLAEPRIIAMYLSRMLSERSLEKVKRGSVLSRLP